MCVVTFYVSDESFYVSVEVVCACVSRYFCMCVDFFCMCVVSFCVCNHVIFACVLRSRLHECWGLFLRVSGDLFMSAGVCFYV